MPEIKDDTLLKIATIRLKDFEQIGDLSTKEQLHGDEEFVGWVDRGPVGTVLVIRGERFYAVPVETWMSFKHMFTQITGGEGSPTAQYREDLTRFKDANRQLFLR